MITFLQLSTEQFELMRTEVTRAAPEEACGLLAGELNVYSGQVLAIIPVTNDLHSSTRFRMAPTEQLKAFEWIENQDWDLIGIYHSHPTGPSSPSATDIAEAYYPEAIHLIWSVEEGSWICSAFSIQNGVVMEVQLSLVEIE